MSPKQYLIQYKRKNYSVLKKFKNTLNAILNEINMHVYHVKFSSIEHSVSNINFVQNTQILLG